MRHKKFLAALCSAVLLSSALPVQAADFPFTHPSWSWSRDGGGMFRIPYLTPEILK